MKIETKIKRVVNSLMKDNNFLLAEAKKAVTKTMQCFNLEKVSPSYFKDALLNTYNVDGVER